REDVLQQEIDDARLGYGELASLDLREAPVAAEEIVDDGKDELRSSTTSAVPRSGRIRTRFKLVGTCSPCTYSLNLSILIGATATSGPRRSILKRLVRKRRAKRSLIISSVGMRPRTIRT